MDHDAGSEQLANAPWFHPSAGRSARLLDHYASNQTGALPGFIGLTVKGTQTWNWRTRGLFAESHLSPKRSRT